MAEGRDPQGQPHTSTVLHRLSLKMVMGLCAKQETEGFE